MPKERKMEVRHIMRRGVRGLSPGVTIADAAAAMAAGERAIPVVADHRVVGIVTDRDLAVRGLAARLARETPVSAVMTEEVVVCDPRDELADVLRTMARRQVRQVPVCTPSGEPLGMLRLDDAAQCPEYAGEVAETLSGICRRREGPGPARSVA
jgi:CBS domain-containing protein